MKLQDDIHRKKITADEPSHFYCFDYIWLCSITRVWGNELRVYDIASQQVAICESISLQVASPQAYELRVCKLTICVPEFTYADLTKGFETTG